ncbi:MAG: 23S rRNA (adenine(2503)-C(2))-methyltransferase RlmN [SAR324 cluster bacterium]|uniref:Probable dual-specificity RNA methyltransferase RlmN n=1 Tax=SAR324 cluster bacterium TaxID=2024889 RepID=A0A7X9FS52_9DELT|nr:23S rRNA (adenine(2503)-C(2))-methyltransferase RlmN [SAR324 cluster bacterium]
MTTKDFFELPIEELGQILEEEFETPSYRARQLYDWVYKKQSRDFSEMLNIGKDLRPKLAEYFEFRQIPILKRELSQDGSRKYLFEMDKGDAVESVIVKQTRRTTLCISSQVGCAMKCAFCRTGMMGFIRNLNASEMVRQVLGVIEDSKSFGDEFQNIVFMGMGEPLHNIKNVKKALKILTSHYGLSIPPRKITVSTAGLVPAIKDLSSDGYLASLAVSLNATTNEVRSSIMPINKKYPIEELLEALKNYPLSGRRKITIEYVLIAGVNDKEEDLKMLPKLLHGIPCKVNLIPYNENAGLAFKSPSKNEVDRWYRTLCSKGIDVTIRWSKGQDINAACGQLATAINRDSGSLRPRRNFQEGT